MGSEQTPSRFASVSASRPVAAPPVEDFAMISLESVETMLRDTGGAGEAKSAASDLPPPLFDPTSPGRPTAPLPPPPPTNPPVTTTGASRFRFADMVRLDGTVDTAAVYRFGKVPDVKLSAELILQALANLPADVPEIARHTTIQITVNSLTRAAGIPVESVIEDARLRHTRLTQFAEALRAETDRDEHPLRQTISDLEALIAAKQSEIESIRSQLQARKVQVAATHRDCDAKIAALQEVIDLLEAKDI